MTPMRVIPDQAATALRRAVPALEATAEAVRRRLPGGGPRRARVLIYTVPVVLALALAGSLAWSTYLSPVTVTTAQVATDVPEQVFGLGTVGARVQSNVGFKVTGVLTRLEADQGDRVAAGQELARLGAKDVTAQVLKARAGVALARASLDKAKADLASADVSLGNAKAIAARRAALVKKGYATQEETQTTDAAARVAAATLVSTRAAVAVAQAALESADAEQAVQEATLAKYRIHAPYDAWVVSRNLELGSAVNPGQTVFTLVETGTVWALAYVDERLAGRLAVGQPAEIRLRSNPAVAISGHVARIEIQSDAVNEERLVDVAFDQLPNNIHLAEQAEAIITSGSLPHAVLVPATAVSDLKDGHGTVWTVEDGRLARRTVTFGRQLLDGRLPIADGLPAGAAVVAKPVRGLRDGRAARIAAVPSP